MNIDIQHIRGNCSALDNTSHLPVENQENTQQKTHHDIDIEQLTLEYDDDHNYLNSFSNSLSDLSLNVVTYIAGYIVFSITKKNKCSTCDSLIKCDESEKSDIEYCMINRKKRGGLHLPSKQVVEICKTVEKILRKTAFKSLAVDDTFFENVKKQTTSFFASKSLFHEEHSQELIEKICTKYLKIRLKSLCERKNEEITGVPIRKEYSKLILFKHQ